MTVGTDIPWTSNTYFSTRLLPAFVMSEIFATPGTIGSALIEPATLPASSLIVSSMLKAP